ncbi:hypothetical protein PGTUg99_028728 [Puccinia graminis f. sp. tritici]|uniref:Integrase core domain-containing protein n=1 Tax=Puccinia graminis f. sp. tritici TaxID=56615 RepID=A0A5B0SET5_PUCGR|nr:hypothetical protein PGTUg99_028728 [Puccinia graminis f. sp. tritici]
MWKLQHKDLQNVPPPPLSPQIQASVLSSHAKGLNLVEIQACLIHKVQLQVSISTFKRYLRRLGVKLLANDIADGRVTMERVFEAVENAQRSLLHNNAGYRRMQTIVMQQYSMRILRHIVYDVLKQVDPEGVAAQLQHACVRRICRTYGPNHIWACDGYNKLKNYGICVYGFINAWSRKILGMFVHVTNNDTRHIGVYFLHLVLNIGGIPLKVTSDYGIETVDMATYQMWLSS